MDSTDEPDLGADREAPSSSFFERNLGAGIAGFLGSLVSAILMIIYFNYNLNDQSPLSELVICSGVCLTTSVIAGPILGVIGGGIGSLIAKNAKNTSIHTAGWLVGGFIAGLLYVPITLLFFELANRFL
jgi:hypothetical protein